MTKAELGEIIARTFALYFFFKAAGLFLVNIAPPFFHPEPLEHWNYIFLTVVVQVIPFGLFALILWVWAKRAGCLIAGDDKDKVISTLSADSFLSVVFAGFGLLLLIPIVVELSNMISMIFVESDDRPLTHFEWLPRAIRLMFFGLLSLTFIFGIEGVKNIFYSIRQAGRDKYTDKDAGKK